MLRVASWNTNHWQYSRRLPDHGERLWSYLEAHEVDVALVQEAAAPATPSWPNVLPKAPWRIDDRRPWASGIAARRHQLSSVGLVRTRWSSRHEFDPNPPSPHRGAVAIADFQVPGFGAVTAISVYALMNPVYAQTTLFRIVADLIPLFDPPPRKPRHVVLGGDFNAHTQQAHSKEMPRYKAIFEAYESLGLVNCFKATVDTRPPLEGCPCKEPICFHVQTKRNPRHKGTPKEKYSGHFDYLFATPELADTLVGCYAAGAEDESVWELSDHCPVIAEFDI